MFNWKQLSLKICIVGKELKIKTKGKFVGIWLILREQTCKLYDNIQTQLIQNNYPVLLHGYIGLKQVGRNKRLLIIIFSFLIIHQYKQCY